MVPVECLFENLKIWKISRLFAKNVPTSNGPQRAIGKGEKRRRQNEKEVEEHRRLERL